MNYYFYLTLFTMGEPLAMIVLFIYFYYYFFFGGGEGAGYWTPEAGWSGWVVDVSSTACD